MILRFSRKAKNLIKVLEVFDRFSKVSGLKHNTSKYEEVGIGGMKGVNVTAKNTAISPDFLVGKFCGKAQFPHQEIR